MQFNKVACALVLAGFALAQPPAYSAVTYDVGDNTSNIPALTGFQTNGALMDGLSVTATFSTGFSETTLWADTGTTSGGVTGTNWSLSLTGDSFNTPWNFVNNREERLVRLVLDGINAFTVFDRTLPSPGTPGSAQGLDFNCTAASLAVCAQDDVKVTYDFKVSVGGAVAVGDLWQTVAVDFTRGPNIDWSFVQDTDNDIRITQVPEPGSLALLALALGGLGFARRRVPAV